jgi:hypothetical protein
MAEPDVSEVVALTNKAQDFWHNGHIARSAEYYERALAAAETLSGAPDCLMVAHLRGLHAMSALSCARSDGVAVAQQRDWARTAVAHTVAAAATLRRRCQTNTLHSVRPVELAFYRQTAQHHMRILDANAHVSAAEVANSAEAVAPRFGYDCLVFMASYAADLLEKLIETRLVDMRDKELRAYATLIADAATLALIRQAGQQAMCEDSVLLLNLRRLVRAPTRVVARSSIGALLADVLRRLERQMQCSDTADNIGRVQRQSKALHTAADAAAAAPGLRTCGLASCGARELHPDHFKSCAACRIPVYCCKEHQSAHWPAHKAACKAARKAAEKKTQEGGASASS